MWLVKEPALLKSVSVKQKSTSSVFSPVMATVTAHFVALAQFVAFRKELGTINIEI
jgi:hypothetical protein